MKQLNLKIKTWGGKRKKAGRKNRSGQLGHAKRERVLASFPLHITMRVKKGFNSLRSPKTERAFKRALGKAKTKGLHVIHYAIESNHIHLFAEARDNGKLRSGTASFGSSFGKAVSKLNRRTGSVFAGRFHLRVLKSPRQTKNALAYVLLNHSKHEGSVPYPDERSSAAYFSDWHILLGRKYRKLVAEERPSYLTEAESWLARVGRRRAS